MLLSLQLNLGQSSTPPGVLVAVSPCSLYSTNKGVKTGNTVSYTWAPGTVGAVTPNYLGASPSIPSSAVITGIEMDVTRYQTGSEAMQVWANFSGLSTTPKVGVQIGTTSYTEVFGGSNDLWGMTSLSPDVINDPGQWMAVPQLATAIGGNFIPTTGSTTGYITDVTVRVYYMLFGTGRVQVFVCGF